MNRGARTVDLASVLSHVSFPEFLDQVQDGLYIIDASRAIVFWNRAAEELTGFSAAQMVGKRCIDSTLMDHTTLVGDSLCRGDVCLLERCIHRGLGGTVPQIILMNTASGKPLPISLSVGPLQGPDGESIGVIAIFRGMREEYQQRKLAVEIQKRMITMHGFSRNGARVETIYAPVDEIGGDFLEAFFLDERTLIATIADATGHGISASLFTMVYKTLLHSSFTGHRRPAEVMASINRGFLETAGVDGFYISSCLVSYDPATRRGSYAAAGHPRGLIFRREGSGYALRERLAIQSLMLGVDDAARFTEIEFQLDPSEFLLISSDGILEAPCRTGGQFGVEGVREFFARYTGSRPLDDLLAEVRSRSSFQPLGDDVSLLLLAPGEAARA
jgi:sigma-B regulation protein RsbU (phosphoserine phosphatase)